MKRNWLTVLFTIALLSIGLEEIQAQRETQSRRRKQTTQEKIIENLWYGGGLNLGFNRSTIGGLGGNTFFIGISPMVGYKIFKNFSMGPRVELQYFTGRFEDGFSNSQIFRFNAFTYGGGVFMRYKVLPIIFTHVEFDRLSQEAPSTIIGNRIATERFSENLFLLGAGYTSGGPVSSEIYILYDVLADDNTTQLPIQYRFGFTFNF